MMHDLSRSIRRRQRGAVLPLVAVTVIVLLGMAALAVDLGMAFTARSEAQRVADAAALAGGSAFLDATPSLAEPIAEARAYEYALQNSVRNEPVDSSEVTVQVITDSMKVRVFITRETLPTWFARLIGIDDVDVGAHAAAQAFQAGEALCLKPFAVPDLWYEDDQDLDGDGVWDEGEEWEFDSGDGDYYAPFDGELPDGSDRLVEGAEPTGYGSLAREDVDRDYGRQIQIKVTDPGSEYQPQPGQFLPWELPEDPDMGNCDSGGGGGGGGSLYRRNICSCNNNPIQLGDLYRVEPGNMVGPTFQGISELLEEDPDAYWDEDLNDGEGGIAGSAFGPSPLASPRVIKVGLYDPTLFVQNPGRTDLAFNNFALLFLEAQETRSDPVVARFMYFATGTGEGSGGSNTGSLVLYLRLVE